MEDTNIHYINNIQISLCIPVYNVRRYLDELLSSIFCQELTDIKYEILFIDDCSTDGSFEYLLEITKDVQTVRVLQNHKNSGISYTRNRLLDNARGEYIWFIDSDDMLYPDSIRILLGIAKESGVDVVLANYIKVSEGALVPQKTNLRKIEFKHVSAENYDWLPDKNNECRMLSVWRGIFKKDFLTVSGLRFNDRVIIKEDALFYYEMGIVLPRIIKCEFPCYCVRQRASSAMRGIDETKARKYFHSSLALVETYQYHLDNPTVSTHSYFRVLIEEEKEQLVKYLLRISDVKFVKESLSILRQQGLYPYKTRRNNFKNVYDLIDLLLPKSVFFWLIYFAHRKKAKVM